LRLVLILAAIAYGTAAAVHRRWVCDDAYISYRYAKNLLDGRGLVYNEGERVEGYSNFLWTIWAAAGMALGCTPETWTIVWGIACYAGSIALLGGWAWPPAAARPPPDPAPAHAGRRAPGAAAADTRPACALPLAALLAATHQDWNIYATSGLETSAFILLLLLAFVLLARAPLRDVPAGRARRLHITCAAAGGVLALASLTRPEGPLFAAVAGLYVLYAARPGWRCAAAPFALAFGVPYGLFLAWRFWYYGDLMPNTYYAKSANLAWWSQGWHYLVLYFRKYAVLLSALPAALLAGAVLRRGRRAGEVAAESRTRTLLLAICFCFPYMLYITRVGGDFMFARMLLPATPFLMILMEAGLAALAGSRPVAQACVSVMLLAALVLPPYPMQGYTLIHGVANEPFWYSREGMRGRLDQLTATLGKYFAGLPVRVAFLGAEAQVMYGANIPVAIESDAGLTDRFIARQPLDQRGRVGHEKKAPLDYLVHQRKVHFTFSQEAGPTLKLPQHIPPWKIELDGLEGLILHWDPVLLAELKQRGARFRDFPASIDGMLPRLDTLTDQEVATAYRRIKMFYFDHVSDPQREAPFRKRLGIQS
jgi:hypothetical protein